MNNFKTIFFFIIFLFLISGNVNSIENRILFKVNNEIITSLDIFNEIKYLETVNEEFKNIKKKQAFEIAKKSIIREKIKEIELKKKFKEIKIKDQFLKEILINHFKKNQIKIKSISDFENYFNLIDINPELIKKKITIEIIWNQIIFKKYNQSIKINRQEITNNLKKDKKQKELFLSEILFNINENESLDEKFNLIKNEIKEKNFSDAAFKYSVSDNSNKGGKLGWIKEISLSKKVRSILQHIEVGNYSNPIVVPGGFLILKIEDVRKIDVDFEIDTEVEKVIKEKTNKQLNEFSNIYFNKIKKDIAIYEL